MVRNMAKSSYDLKNTFYCSMSTLKHTSRLVWSALFYLALTINLSLCRADGALRSEISPQTGHIDDLFLFTVTFEGPQDRITPQLSAGGDFEVQLLGPKTSVSIINGQVFSRQQFIYQLTPKREGTLQTPEVQAQVNGELLSAPAISVVIKSAASQQSAPTGAGAEQIFMQQTAAPESAYVGQQIVNAITVHTRVNLRGVRIEDDAADGFWQETISDGDNSQQTVNGIEYGTARILRALFALKPGKLPLPARKALVQVPVTKNANPFGNLDPFSDDFFQNFFQRTVIQEKKIISNEISLNVKPLPPIPPELLQFSRGLTIVGETAITANYSEAPLKVGESKNISIVVTSTGHLNPLKAPTLTPPTGMKIYDGQTTVKHDVNQGQLLTQKTFNYSVVPTQPGMLRIPGVSLAYFNPDTGSYKLATTSDIALVVAGNPVSQQIVSSPPSLATSAPAISETPPAKETPQPASAPASALPYLEKTLWESIAERVSIQLGLLALAAAIALMAIVSLFSRMSSSQAPRKSARRKLAKATTLEELEAGVRAWTQSSLKGLRSDATFDEIRAVIRSSGRDHATKLALISVLDQLEVARYAGTKSHSVESLKVALLAALT
jgi:hypothetical protein